MNALEPADQAIFEAHRVGCERCMRTAYAALETAAELAYGAPDAAPPPRLRERVLAAAEQHGLDAVVPARDLCTDNAAMVAAAAWWRLRAVGPDPLDAGERDRTSKGRSPPGPKPGASASSATPAGPGNRSATARRGSSTRPAGRACGMSDVNPEDLTSPGTIDDPELEEQRAREAAERERESRASDETKFEELRDIEKERDAAQIVGDVPEPRDD